MATERGVPSEDDVWYCRCCHSLYVKWEPGLANGSWDGSWCARCGSTDIGLVPFSEWQAEEAARDAGRGR